MEDLGTAIRNQVRSLRTIASALRVVAVASGIAGVLTGAAIATHSNRSLAPASGSSVATHPWIAFGLAVVIAAVLLGFLSWCVGRAIGLFAADVAARNGVDLTAAAPSRLPEFAQRPKRT